VEHRAAALVGLKGADPGRQWLDFFEFSFSQWLIHDFNFFTSFGGSKGARMNFFSPTFSSLMSNHFWRQF
jgi:hypothetical protein